MISEGFKIGSAVAPGDFAAAAIELTRQPALWHTLGMAGGKTVLKNYFPAFGRDQRNQTYKHLQAVPPIL